MTLAHELGHGVHQVLAADQGPLMASTPLTLAETASVFGEMLTFQALLKQTTDAKKRKALLASKVEDMINTVVRQIAFYTFERKVHTARKEGELTPDQINQIWLEVQKESLGDGISFGDGYETFWTYIPHFIHSPFYVYAYAFGDCLVNSLYARYRESEQGFQEKYFAMLKAGGTKHHSNCSTLRPRRHGPEVLGQGAVGDLRHDRRAGGDVAVRLARPSLEEAEAFASLHVACWRETYGGLVPDAVIGKATAETRIPIWRAALADPARVVIGAYDGGRPSGSSWPVLPMSPRQTDTFTHSTSARRITVGGLDGH